jgi:uncharacterized protein (TIGR02246 family)
MPKHRMSAEDRLDIFDLFARYAWSYDTGDAKGMAALFTEDGVMEGMDGRRFQGRAAIAGFCQEFIGGVQFRGTQHFNDHLRIDGDDRQCAVRSYWMSVRWDPDSGQRYIKNMGHYHSRCAKLDDSWYFRERVIQFWVGGKAPWEGGVPAYGQP